MQKAGEACKEQANNFSNGKVYRRCYGSNSTVRKDEAGKIATVDGEGFSKADKERLPESSRIFRR